MGDYVDRLNRHIISGVYRNNDEIEEVFDWLKTHADIQFSNLEDALADLGIENTPFTPNDVYPTAPTEPSTTFSWTAEEPSVAMWTLLFNRIQTDIDGGTGLSSTVYNAVVNREQAQRVLNQSRAYQTALDNVGATGFNLPAGHVAAMETEFARDIAEQDQTALDNLLAKDFELATKAKELALQSGTQLEQILRTFLSQANTLSLDAAKAAKDYIIRVFEAAVAAFDSKVRGISAEVEAYGAERSLAEKIAEAKASVVVQALASAYGAMNVGMSWG
jgi:hypothetical protein